MQSNNPNPHEPTSEPSFDESVIIKNPIGQFKIWYDQASAHPEIREANAMIVTTCTKDGIPSARPLLLKEFDEEGFVFFTNYDSRKSNELKENPKAALVFYWEPMRRVIRIEGEVEMVSPEKSEEYFQSRPRGSQIGAWASQQSRSVNSREEINKIYEEMEKKFEGQEKLSKPDFWGGWRVKPKNMEFWQGRENRFHDRLRFSRDDVKSQEWTLERLAP